MSIPIPKAVVATTPEDPAADEVVLNAGALVGLEARVVVLEPQAVATERPRDALAGVARAGVDDDASILDRPQPLDEDAQAILVPTDLLDVVAQVRPHDARPHDGELTAESGRDLRRSGGSRRRGHPEHRRVAERLERAPDEQVVRPEVVSPHADAVHLVDHDEADADRAQRLDERGVAEPLGCGVEDSRPALGDVADASRRHLLIERRVDERRRGGDLGWQLVDLVLHQGDERREDEGRLGPQHRGELVRERLAGARRHQGERVAALHGGADDLLLSGPKGVEPEEIPQRRLQVGHANECTG